MFMHVVILTDVDFSIQNINKIYIYIFKHYFKVWVSHCHLFVKVKIFYNYNIIAKSIYCGNLNFLTQ